MANRSFSAGIRRISFVLGVRSLWSPIASRASALEEPLEHKHNLKNRILGLKSSTRSAMPALQNWVDQGNKLSYYDLRRISRTLLKSKRYHHALECIERLIPTKEGVDKVTNELSLYKRGGGVFGFKVAIRQRATLPPDECWRMYGSSAPNLQTFAIKVLSLNCSAYGCERNWSIFEHIHSKNRSKLEHQKLQDLVFIKYNQALKERFDNCDVLDPILLNDIDDSNEWLVGEMGGDEEAAEEELVLDYDSLTWGDVANVVGAGEPTTFTRQRVRLKKKVTSRPFGSRARDIIEDEEEEEADDVESEEEDEEIYKSSSGESNNDEENLEDLGDVDSD